MRLHLQQSFKFLLSHYLHMLSVYVSLIPKLFSGLGTGPYNYTSWTESYSNTIWLRGKKIEPSCMTTFQPQTWRGGVMSMFYVS